MNMVFNSKTLSGGLGLIVLRIAQAIENGESFEAVTARIDSWINKSILRVSVPTLKYIIRSGRVSPFKSFVAKTLDLKPVIMIDTEGKAVLLQKSFTVRGAMKKTLKSIAKSIEGKQIWEYAISHAGNPEAAEWYAVEIEKITGRKPLFVDHASPVLAANTGAGVVAVSIMLE
jgi:DegV family protein with EDD domain